MFYVQHGDVWGLKPGPSRKISGKFRDVIEKDRQDKMNKKIKNEEVVKRIRQ